MAKFKTERNEEIVLTNDIFTKQDGLKSQLEWIKRQLEYTDYAGKYVLRYDLKRGEIYEFDWGVNVNAEFSNRHYGVVLVDSGASNPLVTVCPLKSFHKEINPRSDVKLGHIVGLGGQNETVAVVNQVRTIDKFRIYLRGIIGTKYHWQLSDSYSSSNRHIMRLNEDKLNMVLEAYKKYLLNELGKTE